jgi:phosphatidylinositol alpha-1,6-mannosyltransferase
MPRAGLLVAQTFPPLIGGSAGVYAALAEAAGGEVAVLTASHDHATGREHRGWRALDAALPYPVRRLRFARPPLAEAAPRGRLARHLHWAPHALRLALAVARESRGVAAVCVCDDDAVGWLVPFARHVLRRRALIYCHGDDLVETDPRAIARRRRWFGEAHAIVAAGDFAAARLTGAYGVPAAKVVTIRNGVDLARFGPRPEPPGLRESLAAEGRRVLLAPTRLVPRKGVDRLIAALPAIRAAEPRALLVVAGEGPQRAALEAAAAGLGVRFLGAVAPAAMPDLYALAELVVLPNRAEPGESDGLPLVFLEANAAGRPVVGGLAGGTPEAVEEGRNGLLVDGEDPAAIAQAVIRLLTDAPLSARLAEGARAVAAERGWGARAAVFLELCRRGP